MKFTLILFAIIMTTSPPYKFTKKSSNDWKIVDDGVMGGRSSGNFKINNKGHGVFSGHVSTENSGGFSSARMSLKSKDLSPHKSFKIKLKGDGKSYQFRVKTSLSERHSYIKSFETNGKWQEIKIPFKDMLASFRGKTLDMPNYDDSAIEEMRFLIGNKKNEAFELEIESIMTND